MTAHFQRGSVLFEQGRFKDAIGEFYGHLSETPEDSRTFALISVCCLNLKNYSEATLLAKKAIAFDPESASAFYAFALTHLAQNEFREAKEAIDSSLRLDPNDADYCALLAQIQMFRRRFQEGLHACERGLGIDPDNVRCHNIRNLLQMALKGKAQDSKVALSLDPEDGLSHSVEGYAQLHIGDSRSALTHFREALRLNPDRDLARRGFIEALKARNPVYRWLFRYWIWKSRFPFWLQWSFLVGGMVVSQIWLQILEAKEPVPIILLMAMVAYTGSAIAAYLGQDLFNLSLRFDREGKHAVSAQDANRASWLGAALLMPLMLVGLGVANRELLPLLIAIRCVLWLLPVANWIRSKPGPAETLWSILTFLMLTQCLMMLVSLGHDLGFVSNSIYLILAAPQKVLLVQLLVYELLALLWPTPIFVGLMIAFGKWRRGELVAKSSVP